MKLNLSVEEKASLEAQHRSERDRYICDRIKSVLLSSEGWTLQQIAQALRLHEETVRRHLQAYQENATLKPANGGSSERLKAKDRALLIAHLEAVTYAFVSEIVSYVRDTFGVHYTVAGMTKWLHRHGFSYKKPKGAPAKADPEKQAAFVAFYKVLLQQTPQDEPILFGDGVHPTMATKLTYGWIRKGQGKLIATTASRTRMNLMGAIDLERMALLATSHEKLDSRAMAVHFQKLRQKYPEAPTMALTTKVPKRRRLPEQRALFCTICRPTARISTLALLRTGLL